MKLVILRYNSQYVNFINDMLEKINITDYVFSSDVSFLSETPFSIEKLKSWPESHNVIVKATEDDVAYQIFDKIVEYKKLKKITTQIKILLVPLINYG